MLSGFQLLTTRKANEKIDFARIQKEFDFSFPPLYKLFLSTFHVGKEYPLKVEKFFNPKRNDFYYCSAPLYYPLKDNEKWFLSVSYFETIEQILNEWKSYLQNEKEWVEFGFLRIAGIGQGGGLFVGTRPENSDVIFQVVWDWTEPYFKVSENIFEFIKGFIHTSEGFDLADGYEFTQLYKEWNEDFWRVKN